jgi:geranylgeranyl diphosphate synthase type II
MNIKEDSNIIKFCIALELLHAFSLVHDDLPAMDNDELRR